MSENELLKHLEANRASIEGDLARRAHGELFASIYGHYKFCYYDAFSDEDVYVWIDPRQMSFKWEEWR